MSDKKLTAWFNINNSYRFSYPTTFDRIIKEIDALEIPTEYIESAIVQYHDGSIVELTGDELSHHQSIDKSVIIHSADPPSLRKIRDIRIFVSLDRLEEDIDELVEEILGKYC